ncbi:MULTISPECIES: type II toxin -antitoxin system TacA 1-like antitoxin [Sphingomonadales]|uniref:type II toxin -antitoxin system TacA 1-like antitoxin n=1 Tax=Sphingomonadales TaxID=204457 RepID=UPI0009FC9C7F|nr:DUF1778 domain-containing protein [Sphingopyxis indica]WOF45591.1 DUF1778 domain-containing protein [Sphingopyxis indica]
MTYSRRPDYEESIILSEQDRAVFLNVLARPGAPNKRLRRAFAEHRRRVVS